MRGHSFLRRPRRSTSRGESARRIGVPPFGQPEDIPDADELEALGAFRSPSDSVADVRPSFVGYPFTLGVASGSPLPTGVVMWTRLAPDPLHGGGVGPNAVVVRWEVAEDENFGRIVQSGSVDAARTWAHSVHVEVTRLEPGRWYFYRFIAGDEVSPVGRTRTAPASAELPQQLRFGLGSCQHFEYGYYAAHRHLVAEDLDLMVLVGDYVYRVAMRPAAARGATARGAEARYRVCLDAAVRLRVRPLRRSKTPLVPKANRGS